MSEIDCDVANTRRVERCGITCRTSANIDHRCAALGDKVVDEACAQRGPSTGDRTTSAELRLAFVIGPKPGALVHVR